MYSIRDSHELLQILVSIPSDSESEVRLASVECVHKQRIRNVRLTNEKDAACSVERSAERREEQTNRTRTGTESCEFKLHVFYLYI